MKMEGAEHEFFNDKHQTAKIAVRSCLHSFNDFAEVIISESWDFQGISEFLFIADRVWAKF